MFSCTKGNQLVCWSSLSSCFKMYGLNYRYKVDISIEICKGSVDNLSFCRQRGSGDYLKLNIIRRDMSIARFPRFTGDPTFVPSNG